MRITSIHLRNFKRFTDLLVRDIPETAKLVVIVGPNGCGKSSLFDALMQWYRSKAGFGVNIDELYYRKSADQPFDWNQSVEVTLAGAVAPHRGCLYVRSAYRNDPDFSIGKIARPNAPSETVKLGRIIENDQTVSENYQRLVYDTMAGVYDGGNDTKTVAALREELIGKVRSSMKAVFGDLVLNNISDPLGSGAFFFEKGAAKAYHYKNLSGGEKAAFDLLLDLHIKKKFFSDAGKVTNGILGGWQLTGIFRWNSGLPAGRPFANQRWATNWQVSSGMVRVRPVQTSPGDVNGEPNLFADPTAAFRSYRDPRPGEAGDRNVLRAPGYVTLDGGLYKTFQMPWERHAVTFRWEVFNVTNTQRLTGFGGTGLPIDPFLLGTTPPSGFGALTATQTPLNENRAGRVMQFALRYDF